MAVSVPQGAGNVSTKVATTSSNTITAALPTNAVTGDVLLAVVSSDFAGAATTVTPGWTRISAARAGTLREVAVFHAFTTAGLPEAPVFTQASAGRQSLAIFRVTGASQTERVLAAGGWAATGDATNTRSFVIPSTGAAAGGLTVAVAYNNTNAAQQPTTAATFDGVPADLQLASYGANSAAPTTSSATSLAVRLSTSSVGPFTLDWGKAVSNSQGTAVSIPAAVTSGGGGGGTTDPPVVVEPEPPVTGLPTEPNTPDVAGLALQPGPWNISMGANATSGARDVSLRVPLNTKVGDVLIAAVTHQNTTGISSPSGWQLISAARPSGSTARQVQVYEYRVLTMPVPDPVFSALAVTEGRIAAAIFRLTGASQTQVLAVAGDWPSTTAESAGTAMVLPALTGAPSNSLKMVVVATNSSAGTAPTAAATNSTALARVVAQPSGGSSTVLNVLTSTSAAAKTVTFTGGNVANGMGFQLAFNSYTPPPPAAWEARQYRNGTMVPVTLDGVQSAAGTKQSIGSVGWQRRTHSINGLLSTTPFFIAHRGSGDNWPEHTMTSYSNAAAYGVKALELSVNTTKDGVMFTHHDGNLLKMTGLTLPVIAELTWDEIKNLDFDTRKWNGEGTPLVKPTLVTDVLDAYASTHVIFIEDKQGTNATKLLNLMDTYPADRDRFVWKQYAGAGQFQAAKDRGYKVWGYFMTDIFSRIQELAPRFDFLGIPHTASDAIISEIVAVAQATGQPLICWEVHYRWMLERLKRLGVRGMMTSNIPYVYSTSTAQSNVDTFSTGRRGHGDLPHTTDNWNLQPRIIPAGGVLSFNMRQAVGYVMGSMCPIPADTYTLEFEMRFDGVQLTANQHSGVWFGHETDLTHRSGVAENIGGYHLIQRGNGVLDLMRHDPGTTSGIPLASSTGPVPVPGQWTKYRVAVSPGLISAERVGVEGSTVETVDALFRGGYFGFQKNYSTADGVEFPNTDIRGVKWTVSQMS